MRPQQLTLAAVIAIVIYLASPVYVVAGLKAVGVEKGPVHRFLGVVYMPVQLLYEHCPPYQKLIELQARSVGL